MFRACSPDQLGCTHYLLLAVLVTRYQVHSLHVPNVDLVTEDIRVENLRDVSNHTIRSVSSSYAHSDVHTFSSGIHLDCRLGRYKRSTPSIYSYEATRDSPLNFFRILAISLLILFSSRSLTLAPRMSAMNYAALSERVLR